MDWHMNLVLPGLYVGNYRDSKDQQQLDKYQITHIIAIHDSPRRLLPDKHYLCVMAADTPDQNLSQYFSVCNDFIHAARLREGNVLIHCLAGMSRSVTVAVAYIMTATNLTWKEALKVVRAGRAVANPNIGFQTQLQEFEMYRLVEERKRLRERFPSTALEQLDRSKCSAALDNYQELLQNKDICEGNCVRGEKCPTGAMIVLPLNGGGEVNVIEKAGSQVPASGNDETGAASNNSVAYMISFATEKWKTLNVNNSGLEKGGDVDDEPDIDAICEPQVQKTQANIADNDDSDTESDEISFEDSQVGEQMMENVLYYRPLHAAEVPNVSPAPREANVDQMLCEKASGGPIDELLKTVNDV
ncbi:uncharacterized protein LOC118739047 isoform X2 [Rhagoletis pomonella]|uniref:uncharacterized protein LOC118739047 isoform X2 n=1 Tax=Rhagoletis pomonella TaxID=28610 RepID=UPI001785D8D5|nr:uncharacterized protein LOC118739047 isoform X2 [Rhagoletis pomonella]